MIGKRWAGTVALVVKLGKALRGQFMRTPGNGSAEAMFAKVVWRLGKVFAVAMAICNVVRHVPVTLTGHLGRAIRQQFNIASQDDLDG